MDLSNYSFYSAWSRVPIEVPAQTPTPVTVTEQPTTGQQSSLWGVGSVGIRACPSAPRGDYPVWRAMDCDPALALSRAVITAPIREAEISFEANEGTPDEDVNAIRDAVEAWWSGFLSESLDALSMGWKPFEVVMGRRNGWTVPVDLKPLAQELSTPLVWRDGPQKGQLAGVQNSRGLSNNVVKLLGPSALIVTIGGHNRDPFGCPFHENAREAWWRKVQCLANLAKLGKKASGIQVKVWYPPAEDEATNHTNEIKARQIAADYMAGLGALFPNATGGMSADVAADYRNIQGLAEAALWKIEIEDFGDVSASVTSLLAELQDINADLSRAWYVPERTAQEGTNGTKAESEVQGEIALSVAQLVFNDIVSAVQRVIDDTLEQNRGPQARGSVKIKAAKLRDVFSEGDWQVIETVLANPDTALAILGQVDIDAVFSRRGIPKLKGVISLADAIQKMQAAKEAAQTKPQEPVGDKPVNGNGRMGIAASRDWSAGLALLGRVGGEDE